MDQPPQPFRLKDEVPQSPSDWQISDLYSQAWKIVKKHKILWVFGAAMAALEFGSGNSGGGGGGNSGTTSPENPDNTEPLKEVFNLLSPDSATQSTGRVLGESTDYIQTIFTTIFKDIPFWMYGVLAGEIIFMILMFVVIRTIYKSWVDAGLLAGTQKAAQDQTPTIESSSDSAFSSLKSFLWLDIIPGLLLTLSLLALVAVVSLGLIFGNLPIKLLSGIIALAGIFVFIYAFIMLALTMIWAKRQVVIEKKDARTALSSGYRIARKKYWASLLLGIINNFLAGLVTLVPVIILVVLFLAGIAIGTGNTDSSVWITLGSIGGIIFLGVIVAFTILSGIITAFKATVWTLAYNKIKGKYDES